MTNDIKKLCERALELDDYATAQGKENLPPPIGVSYMTFNFTKEGVGVLNESLALLPKIARAALVMEKALRAVAANRVHPIANNDAAIASNALQEVEEIVGGK